MAIKTYRDSVTGEIKTETGEIISGPQVYKNRVSSGELSPAVEAEQAPVQNEGSLAPIRDGSGVNVFNKNNDVFNYARELILRKQNQNKDINEAQSYWRGVYSDTGVWGEPNGTPNALKGSDDKIFRYASPDQQEALKTSRQNVASANLKTLQEERAYRGNMLNNTLSQIVDYYRGKETSSSDTDAAFGKKLDNAKKAIALGLQPVAEDLNLSPEEGIGVKLYGTDSWRQNNAGLIPFSEEVANKYGATEGINGAAIFPSEEDGEDALKDEFVKNTSLDDAIKAITGGKYDSKIISASGISMPAADVSNEEWAKIYDKVKEVNEWKEGSILGETGGGNHVFWTEANVKSLASVTGENPNELWKLSDKQLSEKEYMARNDIVMRVYDKMDKGILLENNITKQLTLSVLSAKAAKVSNESIAETLMETEGYSSNEANNIVNILEKEITKEPDIYSLFFGSN